MNIMASSSINSQQTDGETVETVTDFIFLGSKITADTDCSHEIKMLTAWKKSYDQLRQHIKKQRHGAPTRHPGMDVPLHGLLDGRRSSQEGFSPVIAIGVWEGVSTPS